MKPNYIAAADALDRWRDDLMTGKAPVLYPLGAGELGRIEVGPGLVTLIGGAPGAGKTAFTMQCVIDALRLTPSLRALVCNIEMPPGILLDRQLSRLSGVDLTTIRYRRIGAEHADRIDQGINTLAAIADRLSFLRPPFDLDNVAAAADDFGASLLVLDYIQRIAPPGEHDNRRNSVDATMNYLRQFADADVAVVVVSAVSRAKDGKGRSSYSGEGLNLASFRESSELEFGADDAFILHPDDDDADGDVVKLKHLKSRHGECRDMSMRFDRRRPGSEEKQKIWELYLRRFEISKQKLPKDTDWTGAEIRACCRLASLLDVSLTEAAKNVVPVAITAAEQMQKLRSWAAGRCLDASRPGIYTRGAAEPETQTARRVSRASSN